MALVDSLIKEKWLKTPIIIEAFRQISRKDFMPENIKVLYEINEAMPIGQGQTISQPMTVAFMLENLNPKPGNKILDVGSGSGWTTALLAHIAGKNGKVVALEVIPELKDFGEKNVAKYDFIKNGTVEFVCCNACNGYIKEAPFDRILASASAQKIPEAWKEQLKVGGRIVAPVREAILVLEKISEKEFKEKIYPGFVFVPLI